MDSEFKWLMIACIFIAFAAAISASVHQYQDAKIKIEAIKAGLHQEIINGDIVWSK